VRADSRTRERCALTSVRPHAPYQLSREIARVVMPRESSAAGAKAAITYVIRLAYTPITRSAPNRRSCMISPRVETAEYARYPRTPSTSAASTEIVASTAVESDSHLTHGAQGLPSRGTQPDSQAAQAAPVCPGAQRMSCRRGPPTTHDPLRGHMKNWPDINASRTVAHEGHHIPGRTPMFKVGSETFPRSAISMRVDSLRAPGASSSGQ
jgi:hypothetical protein